MKVNEQDSFYFKAVNIEGLAREMKIARPMRTARLGVTLGLYNFNML